MRGRIRWALVVVVIGSTAACSAMSSHGPATPDAARLRTSVLARSQVWQPTSVRSRNLKAGPKGPGAFPFGATVRCAYLDRPLGGRSPKFLCTIGRNDTVKVKYGAENGEVFGEVLATRLLWALGFGADRMYSVRVICSGCPVRFGGVDDHGERYFDPAVIERPMRGAEWEGDGAEGWAWSELNVVNPALGGAPEAHRDALALLAVFMQHTDSKSEQQRLLCLGTPRSRASDSCANPFLMLADVGLTFGRWNRANANDIGSANLTAWRQTPVWKEDNRCVGNLTRSFTGTLDDPVISEAGRRFLADLLNQLSDGQLRELFEAARVDLRLRSPGDAASGTATVDEWVDAFKAKRAEIQSRRCA